MDNENSREKVPNRIQLKLIWTITAFTLLVAIGVFTYDVMTGQTGNPDTVKHDER